MKEETESLIIIDRDFNSLLTKTDRKTTKKSAWTEMTKMMLSNNLLSAECTLFLSTHEMFSRTDHLLSHKESLKSLND